MKKVILIIFTLGVLAVIGFVGYKYRYLVTMFLYFREPPQEYLVPVKGVKKNKVYSSFNEPRPGGRKHKGIDIFAPKGTPVITSTNSVITRIGINRLGGKVVWAYGEGKFLYYYAHLSCWEDGISVGDRLPAGIVIGYVGNTGNAHSTPSHLHFGMYKVGFSLRHLSLYQPVDPYIYLTK